MHKPNKPLIPLPARRRSVMPELGDIESLIGQARALRLELTRLAAFEPISESARSGAEALTQAGVALEKITELLVSARSVKRSHHRNPLAQTPPLPDLERELP